MPGNAAPVKEVSYCRFDEVSSAVLPVEIVGVFQDINMLFCYNNEHRKPYKRKDAYDENV